MTQKSTAQLCAEEALEGRPPRKLKEHCQTGIYEARPAHFGAVWPTVRTETFVDMVFGSIKQRGRATQDAIAADTRLDKKTIGEALADLMLWKRTVTSEVVEERRESVREYFVR